MEDVAMRTFDFAPLYRSTVGFDRLFDMLEGAGRPDWPPYDIEKRGENEYAISMALAGFRPDEVEVTQHGTSLLVSGQKKADPGQHTLLHQGIAFRNFRQSFNLAEHVKVAAANLENGLLTIDLVREVPEQLKPRRIEIVSGDGAPAAQDNRPAQLGQSTEQRSAA
jgi:molecular chaperone IbpA